MRCDFVLLFVLLSGFHFLRAESGEADASRPQELPAIMQSSPCSQELREIFKQWQIRGSFTAVGDSFFGPTTTPAVWIQYTKLTDQGDQLILHRGHGEGLVVYLAKEDCKRQIAVQSVDPLYKKFPGTAEVFDDTSLASMAVAKETALFYSISPHMNVSGMGWEMAVAAANQLKIKLLVVLDSSADPASIEILNKKWKVPLLTVHPLGSNILKLAGMAIHYPSYLYMKNGTLLPIRNAGFRESKANYVALFKSSLGL